jgi:archaellum component FlaC
VVEFTQDGGAGMGTHLMPADTERVYTAIGELQSEVSALSDKFDVLREQTIKEQRTVHDIVDATSEAIRNLTRIIDEMKPLTDDYREKRAEMRGAARFANIIYIALGGSFVLALNKLTEWISVRPHP